MDLDSPLNDTRHSTPGPSNSPSSSEVTQSNTEQRKDDGTQNGEDSSSSKGLVGRTADFGKAVVKAAVELNREEHQLAHDRLAAARNAASHAYESLDHVQKDGFFGNENDAKGDEALPKLKDGEGEPPTVIYSEGEYACSQRH